MTDTQREFKQFSELCVLFVFLEIRRIFQNGGSRRSYKPENRGRSRKTFRRRIANFYETDNRGLNARTQFVYFSLDRVDAAVFPLFP